MKKNLLLALACLLFVTKSLLASGGPDAYGYTWITSLDAGGPTYSWIDITSRSGVQTVTGLADDNSAASMINLGINFHYYWNDYTQLKVGSNGWVSFSNVSNIASCFPTIPTAGGPEDYLAPLMGDLNFTGSGNVGQVEYWSNNVDTFIISYINVPFWSVNAPGWVGSNSFQVILCNSDSSITYQYGSLSGFNPNAACVDLTVGIENSTGNIGLQVHSDTLPPNNYAIRFKYPNPVLLSIQDVLPAWNQHADNGADFILVNTPVNLVSNIHNSGNSAVTTTVNLQSTILDAALATVLNNSGSLSSLAAGDDTAFTFSTSWTPTLAGQYTNRTTTTNSQDVNAANDVLNTELEVVDPCAATMSLSYVTGNTPDGSLNWNGGAGDDGAAVYFVPPVYPYTVTDLQYYISSNVSDGYIAEVYDDDGPNGTPGTLLFTTTVPSASVITAAWNTVPVTSTVTLNSGGFYVVWLQGGTSIFLGTETAGPRCHHNFEILDGGWATLRYDETQDLLIRAAINGFTNVPTAAFNSAVNQQTANFTDNTSGLVTSWSWDFGDSQTSTQQNPSHLYAAPGTYTVCLTATSPCGTNQICQAVTVCALPIAAYSSMANSLNVSFTDASTGTVDAWSWDFGDAQTSTQQNPSHTYGSAGTYTVCLVATNACGDADTICQAITVCDQLVNAFSYTQNEDTLFTTDMSSGQVTTWQWDFGDTQSSTSQNAVHEYATGGLYQVCLTTTDACGMTDSSCQMVMILITSLDENANVISGTYPNPVNNELNILFGKEMKNAKLEIFDQTGRVIISEENISGKMFTANVTEIPAGIYLVRITDENVSSSAQFIKQ